MPSPPFCSRACRLRRALAPIAIAVCAAAASPAAAAPVTQAFKHDHFGFRPGDTKIVIATQNPGGTVQVRRAADDGVAFTIPTDGGSITAKGTDGMHSGDAVWWIDLSDFTTVGEYRLYSPTLAAQSYDFDIRGDVYATPMRAALRTFYLQRCNVPKTSTPASAWDDAASCHDGDAATGPAAGHTNHGTRDLRGGWHDAGDYNKYVWGAVSSAILSMLRAYEDNPGSLRDDDTGIPESGNGLPDLLDEIQVELDWIMEMQLPSGAVLSQMHVDGFASDSPPSADMNVRYYQNPNLESGAVAAGTLALAARVFEAEGQSSYAATLKSAALASWTWLQTQGGSAVKAWAAAEIFRIDPTQTAARDYVDNFYPSQWNGRFFNVGAYDTFAALTYVSTTGATPAVVTNMLANITDQVDYIFSEDSLYRNGMPSWSYHWGSNAMRAHYGLFLLRAAALGETGSYSAGDCYEHALDLLRFFHGQNPLNMLYLTNMAALGGEHSSFQLYHAWYGDSWSSFSSTNYFGKPSSVTEPAYPYYAGTDNHGVSDNKVSLYGPAPGFVPGGPNKDYGGTSSPPLGSVFYEKFYRDWADQIQWTAMTWEITENSISYQGPYVALAAYFQGASACDDDDVCEPGENAANCPNDCSIDLSGDAYVGYRILTPATDELGNEIAGGNELPASWNVTLDDQAIDSSLGDDPENFTIGRSLGLMSAAGYNAAEAADAQLHYVRYALRPAAEGIAPEAGGSIPPAQPHVPRRWTVQNDLGTFTVRSIKATSLLLPAGADPSGTANDQGDATHYRCYRIKTESGPSRPQALTRDMFDDCARNAAGSPGFAGSAAEGSCLLDVHASAELCNPVAKTEVLPPRTTSAVIDESTPSSQTSLLCSKAKLARKIGSGAAGLLTGMAAGSSISPLQTRHLSRRTSDGNGVSIAPGNQFPAPVMADTIKLETFCLPTHIVAVAPAG
ncbi:MAG TPA: glycoside hydrolase family 9 protein [Candidatus Limnocylindrales bacterium]|nr:glycoside hydrolase family 9 protein [Candidatus Limnocylindrales bacterium]